MSQANVITADIMDPTNDSELGGAEAAATAPEVEFDEATRKTLVILYNLCKDSIEFSTICDPKDTTSKLATLIANCLGVSPASFNTEIKGNKAFFKVSPDRIFLVIARFFSKANVVEDDNFGEFLEARIDTDEGQYYKFRISHSQGGVRNTFKPANRGRGRGGRGDRGRGGRGAGINLKK
jgi:hypothetical protein